jgi:hypothetical protein
MFKYRQSICDVIDQLIALNISQTLLTPSRNSHRIDLHKLHTRSLRGDYDTLSILDSDIEKLCESLVIPTLLETDKKYPLQYVT